MEELEIAVGATHILQDLAWYFIVGGIAFVIAYSLRRFWTDTIIYVLMRWSDIPRFSDSEKTGVEVRIEGEWWDIEKIESPLFGGGKVFFKRKLKDKSEKCKDKVQMDMSLEDYYHGSFQYRM
jgi:hypothetical protein